METKKEWPKKWKWIYLISTLLTVIIMGFPTLIIMKEYGDWVAIPGIILFIGLYLPWQST